jgi:hypothetical protein
MTLLSSLNLVNGNNTAILEIHTENNANLNCIDVDNVSYSNTNWTGANFTFDSGISFSTDCSTLSTSEKFENKQLSNIFPNPSSSQITLQSNGTSDIEIYNAIGEQILHTTLNQELILDISNWSNGIYFIKNTTTGKAEKFVKE